MQSSSMAAPEEDSGSGRKRKRMRLEYRKKLLDNEKVEVRSLEQGFLGSWHSATITACQKGARCVMYDHSLSKDNLSEKLVERISVPPIIDGYAAPEDEDLCSSFRGLIRPLPPVCVNDKHYLYYGLCVDAHYDTAWWEGVIFDYEHGCEERTIFFPDLGDEIKCNIDLLRHTRDWNGATEDWKHRGNWWFLELIEEYEKEFPLCVSVKQIWYDVRLQETFRKQIREWTCPPNGVWRFVVLKSIEKNFNLTVNEFLHRLGMTEDCTDGSRMKAMLSVAPGDDYLKQGADLVNSHAIVPSDSLSPSVFNEGTDAVNMTDCTLDAQLVHVDYNEGPCSGVNPSTISSVPGHNKLGCVQASHSNPDQIHGFNCHTKSEGFPSINRRPIVSKRKRTDSWLPVGEDILPGAEFCPEAVTEYASRAMGRKVKNVGALRTNVRKHLAYLGWKMEFRIDEAEVSRIRLRYLSPDNNLYLSLYQVCQILRESDKETQSPGSEHDCRSLITTSPGDCFSYQLIDQPHVNEERSDASSSSNESSLCDMPESSGAVDVEPQYCPEAVKEWYLFGGRVDSCRKKNIKKDSICEKAKKHLAFLGWKLWYANKGAKRELRYSSPKGKCFYSLRTACKSCFDEEADMHVGNGLSTTEFTGRSMLDDTSHRKVKQKNSSGAALVVHGSCTTRVLRTQKRASQMVTHIPSHSTPRTVISWLIDNNVVLPRAKVHYRSRKGRRPLAEGRLSRDGVKCNCCQKVFTLTSFEAHAGSNSHRPAANIFLEDGRSLMECQRQGICSKESKNLSEPSDNMDNRNYPESDYICSICHYGGELILCDQCPSSFHKNCLGLEDIPCGEWFCPSCCCRICMQGSHKRSTGDDTDTQPIKCHQCEHEYHMGCLRESEVAKLENNVLEKWFCSQGCEKVFMGLEKLLGEAIPVGVDLTWRLLKSRRYVTFDFDEIDVEAVTEDDCKLNVAVGVMHECFEPVREPNSSRDLVEDVIFSRSSQLKRLSFQGFYTVLLEKNDELISAATVRVHGEKVAEVPLVGTRFQYRRLGMCRILMDELEKRLSEIGVKKLVLPAVRSVLSTWTGSFGFKKFTNSERQEFVDCTFLEFPETMMCQKVLTKTTVEARDSNTTGDRMVDGCSPVSEAFQAERIGETEITEKGPFGDAAGMNYNCSNDQAAPDVLVTEPSPLERKRLRCCMNLEYSMENADHALRDNGGDFKSYKRMKLLASGA